MGRRRPGRRWEAQSVPFVRAGVIDRVGEAFADSERHAQAAAEYLGNDSGLSAERFAEIYQYKTSLQQLMGIQHVESEAASAATLYWATAGQTRLAAAASQTLPAWSVSEAVPSADGLILFEEVIGTTRRDVSAPDSPRVSVDGLLWTTQGGVGPMVVIQLTRDPMVQSVDGAKYLVAGVNHLSCPLSVTEDPDQLAQDEEGVLQILGALWLLMGEERVCETTTLTTRARRPARIASGGSAGGGDFESVVVVDLHPRSVPAQRDVAEGGDRIYRRRWWVEGHWRQQACGPNRSERRPMWIAPYVKGPEGAPFTAKPEYVYRLNDPS